MASIQEGLLYIRRRDILLITLLVTAVVGTFAPNFSVTIPVFAQQILHQGETGYGFLMSFMGAGSLCGALMIATLSNTGPKKFVLYVVPLIVGTSLALVGTTNVYFLTSLTLAITGFFFIAYNSSANSVMQLNTEDSYRGRVMSVYTLVNAGSTPIGNLFVGSMDNWFGARMGFIASGIVILVLMLPIYCYLARKKKAAQA